VIPAYTPPSSPRAGAWMVALSALLFGLLGGVVKHLSATLSPETIVFCRNAVGLLALVPFVHRAGVRSLATRHFFRHVPRAAAGLASMYLSFFAIGRLRLADAYVLSYTAPLFMPLIAKIWLREKIPAHSLQALALGFLGVLLVMKPGTGVFQPVALAALASGFLGAVAQVGIRQLTETETSTAIVFYFGLLASVVSGLPLAAGSGRVPPIGLWGWILLLGGLATVAQLIMTGGYRRSSPGRVGPLMYIAVAVAALLDWVLWARRPDFLSALGTALIVVAGVLIIHRTQRAVPGLEEPAAA
jgi:drug/metabolite transporter (DMT)-like permease